MHPNYISNPRYNDIALVRLRDAVDFDHEVAPICLDDADTAVGTVCAVAGFGMFFDLHAL